MQFMILDLKIQINGNRNQRQPEGDIGQHLTFLNTDLTVKHFFFKL